MGLATHYFEPTQLRRWASNDEEDTVGRERGCAMLSRPHYGYKVDVWVESRIDAFPLESYISRKKYATLIF